MQLFFTRAWISIFNFFFSSPNLWLPLLLPLLLLLPSILFLFLPSFRRHLFLTEVPHHKHYQSLTAHLQILTSILRTLILHDLTLTIPPHNLQHLFHPHPLLLTKDGELLYLQVPLKRHLLFWKKCTKAPRLQQ